MTFRKYNRARDFCLLAVLVGTFSVRPAGAQSAPAKPLVADNLPAVPADTPPPDSDAQGPVQAFVPTAAPAAAAPIEPVTPIGQAAPGSFWNRFIKAYRDDWHPGPDTGEPAKFRGYPPPEQNPPFPFTLWPMGGTVGIGYPNATAYPLWTALSTGPHGDWWKKANIQIYGWANAGMNFSTSNESNGKYANSPAAYNQIANSFQLDQLVTYIERTPDTIQTDHFDWGFRLTSLYGLDYRFTTAKGYFSNQLLTPKPNGSIGNQYGWDPVMFYVDLYFPHVAQGMDLRIGRYVSLPDIEAQLAPNNYTYTHSLTYIYDCYTQTGANATIRLSNAWIVQLGVSPGCDTAAWKPDARLTFNACVSYSWRTGQDSVYLCANSINDSKYAYNNLAAYYATWYHKINAKWHVDTESWYQYMRNTPNIFNSIGQTMVQTNSNGAWCNSPTQVTCYAPEWSILNYTLRQLKSHDFIGFRDEFFDDLRGQRTGFKNRYVEGGVSWNHWIGTTLVFRPEVRWEHAFDNPAYDAGTRRSQFMFAADVIWFY